MVSEQTMALCNWALNGDQKTNLFLLMRALFEKGVLNDESTVPGALETLLVHSACWARWSGTFEALSWPQPTIIGQVVLGDTIESTQRLMKALVDNGKLYLDGDQVEGDNIRDLIENRCQIHGCYRPPPPWSLAPKLMSLIPRRAAPPPPPMEQSVAEGAEGDADACAICMIAAKEMAFIPCGHMACCRTCAPQCSTCPICRTPITQRLRVYI